MRKEFALSLQKMALAIGIAYAIGGVLQVWFGHLTDKLGRKRMLQVSLGTASLWVAAHAVAVNVAMLTILRAGAIFSGGALYPATGAMVTEVAPARYRGIMAGLLQTAYPLGWFVAAMVAAPFLSFYGWRALFLVSLLSLPYLWVVRRYLTESTRFAAVQSAAQTMSFPDAMRALLSPGMRYRTVILLLAQFLFVLAYGGMSVWFPTYLVESRGLPIGSATLLVGLGNAVAIIGYVGAAVLGEFYLSRRTTVVLWTLLGTVALFVLVWGTSGYWGTLIGFAVMTIFFYGTAAVKFAFVAEVFPTPLRATGLAVCSSLPVNFGIAVGPSIIAYSVGQIGWDKTLTLAIGLPLAAAGLLYLALKPVPSGVELEAMQKLL